MIEITNDNQADGTCRARSLDGLKLTDCTDLPLKEGEAFEFNNGVIHGVRNEGPGPRVHLVIDVAEQKSRSVTRLKRGHQCSYMHGKMQCL